MSRQSEPELMIKAAKSGDFAAALSLLTADSSVIDARDSDGSTPLHCAAWRGHADIVTLLLDHGADIQAKNSNTHWGDTPLHAAAHGNRRDVAEVLIARGADLHSVNAGGRTPLQETEIHRATAAAAVLKRHGAG